MSKSTLADLPAPRLFRRPGGRCRRAQVDAGFAATLAQQARNLAGLGAQFEPHFLELGAELQSAFEDTLNLTQHIRETLQTVSGDGDNNLLQGVAHLSDSLIAELARCQADMTRGLGSLRSCTDHLVKLQEHVSKIDKIALYLRVIGLNIGVESSRSEQGRSMFGIVAKDVTDLSEKIHEITAQLRNDAENAAEIQNDAYQ